MEKPTVHPTWMRLFFFWSGVMATVAYRSIVVVNNYSKPWAQTLWYVGTIGFIFYFAHRYQISEKRSALIREHGLDKKIADIRGLDIQDKDAMRYIFHTLSSSKEKWNSIIIFVASGIALVLGLYLDFFKR